MVKDVQAWRWIFYWINKEHDIIQLLEVQQRQVADGKQSGFVVGSVVIGDELCGMAVYTFKVSDVFEKVGVLDWEVISKFLSN